MEVLGIEVRHEELLRWRDWLMPDEQPFVVPRPLASELGLVDGRPVPMEVIDSFELYFTPSDRTIVLLARGASRRLPVEVRRAQPAPHRWPTAEVESDVARTVRRVEVGARRRASVHRHVRTGTWRAAQGLLPGARAVAGTFSGRSGPNCFGAVMAAAGVEGAGQE